MSTNKPLIDIIDEMLNESIADDINKITADNQKKKEAAAISPDTQGVLGKESGAALDAGGDKDVGGSKGDNPSDASDNSSEVLGGKTGAALDGGGDKDVGKIDGKTAQPSGASAEVEADKGPHDQANDPGLKEFYDAELDEWFTLEELEALAEDGYDVELLEGDDLAEEEEAWDFYDEDGQELSEEEEMELIDFLNNSDVSLEEALTKSQQNAIAGDTERQQRANKNISLAGPGGKKFTATKGNSGKYDTSGDKVSASKKGNTTRRAMFKKTSDKDIEKTDKDGVKLAAKKSKHSVSNPSGEKERTSVDTKMARASGTAHPSAKNVKVSKSGADNMPNSKGPRRTKDFMGTNDQTSAAKGSSVRVQKIAPGKAADYGSVQKVRKEPKGTTKDIKRGGNAVSEDIQDDAVFYVAEWDTWHTEEELLGLQEQGYEFELEEDADLEEAQGEKLEKILGDANKAMRPDQEKDMDPKTKGDSHGSEHKPHDQATDPNETPTKANPKGAVSEESAIDEEFKAKAEVIFEAAVGEKVNIIKEEMKVQYDEMLQEEINDLNEKVAKFVEEAVEEWLTENALEVRYSLRTEVSENFIKGLKGLFNESYIEIPEEDYSVVDELTESVEEQKEQLDALTEELKEAKMFILEAKKKDIVNALSEDLTQTQAVRLEKLAEGLEAEDVAEFEEKVAQLKEGYFDPSAEQPLMSLTEEVFTGTEHIMEDDSGSVSQYAKFLSKTVLK